ncbi:hypothetical protein DL95DRAFT_508681 [Leptodontidium sp. 2 PMI_412]|nr:hypothetical protein DL95DRAFT_508681 [Leptodontidium sp. 2 PMI_412]
MPYTSLYRLIYFIARYSGIFETRDGYFNRDLFLAEFKATREETRRDYHLQGPLSRELQDFLNYKTEQGFWYTVFRAPKRLGPFTDSSDDVGPFPCAPVRDPRGPQPQSRLQNHFGSSSTYSVRCHQRNTGSAFIGKHGDGVRALGKYFSGNLFFQTRKSSRGGHWIWAEPRFPEMQESAEVKQQLEDAYRLMVEWGNLPVDDLPAMDVFLEDYLARQNRPAPRSDEGGLGPTQTDKAPRNQKGAKVDDADEDEGDSISPMGGIGSSLQGDEFYVHKEPTLSIRPAQSDAVQNPRKRVRVDSSDVENIPILVAKRSDATDPADASIAPTSIPAVSDAPTNTAEPGPASNHLKRAMELLDGEEFRDNKRRRTSVSLVSDVTVAEGSESHPTSIAQLFHDQGSAGPALKQD